MLIIVALVLIVLTIFTLKWLYVSRKFADLEKLPGPTVFSVVMDSFKEKTPDELFNTLKNLNKIYGPVVKIWVKPFKPVLFVSSSKYVEKIIASNAHMNKTRSYEFLVPIIKQGLVVQKAADWKPTRKSINPAFQQNVLMSLIPVINHHGNILINILKDLINGKILDIRPYMDRFTLDIICGTSCKETNDSSYPDAMAKAVHLHIVRIHSVLQRNSFIYSFTRNYREQQKEIKFAMQYVKNLMNSRKNKINGDADNTETIIDLLFEKTTLTEEEILEQLPIFVFAGYDTSASSLSFGLYELSRRPDIQKKILDESVQILGSDKEAVPTFSDLQQMKYLKCFIKEVLRFYTIGPFIDRKVENDLTIAGGRVQMYIGSVFLDGVKIPKGTDISFSIHNIHHSEEYFPNPNVFDPDRFLPENASNIKPHTFLPFSEGHRDCIGKHFAMIVITSALTKLIRNFEIFPTDGEFKIKFATELVLRSLNGLPIQLKLRNM